MSGTGWGKPIILNPREAHTHTMIMLHGRGSTGEEFSSDVFETQCSTGETLQDLLPGCKWVFLSAPLKYSAVFEEDLSQWYEISSLTEPDAQRELQLVGLRASVLHVREVIDGEIRMSPSAGIVLCGISQGFTIAVLALLMGHAGVKALVGFSSWLPLRGVIESSTDIPQTVAVKHAEARLAAAIALHLVLGLEHRVAPGDHGDLPIFIGHCANDDVVDIQHGKDMRELLARLGYKVTWSESPWGGHWINEPDGMDNLKSFLWANRLAIHGLSNS